MLEEEGRDVGGRGKRCWREKEGMRARKGRDVG